MAAVGRFAVLVKRILAKQRNGSIGTVSLAWISELTKFENLVHEQ